jgi:hypothetical protein
MNGLELSERIKALTAEMEKYSKTALVHSYALLVVSNVYPRADDAEYRAALDTAQASVLTHLKEQAPTARLSNRSRRFQRTTARLDQMLRHNADCTTCDDWRPRGAKKKGTRIPGGKGKCTRPGGHCRPSEVRT